MKNAICLFVIWILSTASALAQTDLRIGELFRKSIGQNTQQDVVLLSGGELKNYNLSVFKSVSIKARDNVYKKIEEMVLKDVKGSSCHESSYRNGRLYHGLFQLESTKDGNNRYIFFRNNSLSKKNDQMLTLIYMEGSADIEQLRKTFKK